MNEISIQNNFETMLPSSAAGGQSKDEQGQSFSTNLSDAIKDVNRLKYEADVAVKELATGKETDIHNTMIALEKASVSFQLMMQVRNKIVTAYETVMNRGL